MLRSWRSEDYKRGERPELADLPVRLAYANCQEAPSWPAREYPPPTAILARAEALGSPPLAWVRFLAPRPDLLADWTHLYWTSVHSDILGPRVGQLVRAYMGQLLDCPAWAPPDAAALQTAGLTPADLGALRQGQFSGLSLKEQAALAYARELVADSDVPDAVFEEVAAVLSEREIVTLGFAVAVQNGTIRVYRSMLEAGVQHDVDRR